MPNFKRKPLKGLDEHSKMTVLRSKDYEAERIPISMKAIKTKTAS